MPRKRHGTRLLILPGGCLEENEAAMQCLQREIKQELGEDVSVSDVEFVGTYNGQAATADGVSKSLSSELYRGDLSGTPVASSEIAELVWFVPGGDETALSPSLRNQILPDLVARKIVKADSRAKRRGGPESTTPTP